MKARFDLWNGKATLVVIAESGTDSVALDRWQDEYFGKDPEADAELRIITIVEDPT